MRKLLKEAAEVLRRGQADKQADLAERITAALAEPEQDAMEIVDKIREHRGITGPAKWVLSRPKAAALIADFGRRVPRAFINDLLAYEKDELVPVIAIAAKYGVKMEDAK